MTTAFANPHTGLQATVAETGAAGGAGTLLRAVKDFLLYRRTLTELRALNAADLADLGLSRFELKHVAREAIRGY